MISPERALSDLKALSNRQKAAEMAAYHKASRPCIGVSNPEIDRLCKDWRKEPDKQKLAIAHHLWASKIHEAMIGAAKLLSRPRFLPGDGPFWDEIQSWVADFDAWAIADHACKAGSYRLLADPGRLDQVEGWSKAENMWRRRAALVITLPWARFKAPDSAQSDARRRILGWAAGYLDDKEWFIQKAVSW